MLKELKEILFPRALTCSLCRREVFHGEPFCKECISSLPYNDGPICDHCGRKTSSAAAYCDSCREKNIQFDKARSPFCYEKPISYALQRLKYENAKFLAEDLAPYLVRTYLTEFWTVDCIVFAPMTEKRKKARGYNQAELLVNAFSGKTNIPVLPDVLYKRRETESQVNMTQKERLMNLSGSFGVRNAGSVKGKSVLFIDDVLTTGATADCCAFALKRAGAASVYVLTAASVSDRSAKIGKESEKRSPEEE